jgi:hypothetical protein
MSRKVFLLAAGMAVVALLLLDLGSPTPAARADDSSMSWDVAMDDPGSGVCPGNANGIINTGECPDIETNFWIQTAQTAVSDEPHFDLASTEWTVVDHTTSTTEDLDGNTIPDPGYIIPVNGMRATPGNLINLGATVGNITFSTCGNVVPASVTFANNVDDVAVNADATVRGQPAVCDTSQSNPSLAEPFMDSFDIWNATLNTGNLVSIYDDDGDGIPQTQSDYFSPSDNCALGPGTGTPDGRPDAIDCTPEGLMPTLTASSLRGVARLRHRRAGNQHGHQHLRGRQRPALQPAHGAGGARLRDQDTGAISGHARAGSHQPRLQRRQPDGLDLSTLLRGARPAVWCDHRLRLQR